MPNLTFRNALISDIPFIVNTIIEAEKSGTDVLPYCTIFGLSEFEVGEFLTEMLLEEIDGCELAISSFLIAELDGEVAGALSAWIEGNEGVPSSVIKGNLLNYVLPKECLLKAISAYEITNEIHIDYLPNTIQIGAGFVAEKFRGKRILSLLNSEVIKRLVEQNRNVSQVCAQIFSCNAASLRTYEKAGFRVIETKESLDSRIENFLPSNKKYLLIKEL